MWSIYAARRHVTVITQATDYYKNKTHVDSRFDFFLILSQ